jgi:carbonic anhydrase
MEEIELIPHEERQCQAIVVSCLSYRIRGQLRKWTIKKFHNVGFDRVAVSGGVRNPGFVLEQVELSYKLHKIKEVYLINHENCGTYGTEGTMDKHKQDLLFAKKIIKEKYPDLKVYPLFLKLDGSFTEIK